LGDNGNDSNQSEEVAYFGGAPAKLYLYKECIYSLHTRKGERKEEEGDNKVTNRAGGKDGAQISPAKLGSWVLFGYPEVNCFL